MCMEDIILGRNSPGSMVALPNSLSSAPAISGDPNRRSITFSVGTSAFSGNAVEACFSIINPAIFNNGIIASNFAAPVTLTIEKHGLIVTLPWYYICDNAIVLPCVIWSSLREGKWQDVPVVNQPPQVSSPSPITKRSELLGGDSMTF